MNINENKCLSFYWQLFIRCCNKKKILIFTNINPFLIGIIHSFQLLLFHLDKLGPHLEHSSILYFKGVLKECISTKLLISSSHLQEGERSDGGWGWAGGVGAVGSVAGLRSATP